MYVCTFLNNGGGLQSGTQRKRCCPDFPQLPLVTGPINSYKPSQLPGDHTVWHIQLLVHGTDHTHKPSRSYHAPTYYWYYWIERVHVWMKCLTQDHNAMYSLAQPAPRTRSRSLTSCARYDCSTAKYVCMCVCVVYVRTYVCMYVCTYVRMYVCINV